MESKFSDQLIFDYIEGNLAGTMLREVEQAMASDPSLRLEVACWKSSQMTAPANIHFPVSTLIQPHWITKLLGMKGMAIIPVTGILVGCIMLFVVNQPGKKVISEAHSSVSLQELAPKNPIQRPAPTAFRLPSQSLAQQPVIVEIPMQKPQVMISANSQEQKAVLNPTWTLRALPELARPLSPIIHLKLRIPVAPKLPAPKLKAKKRKGHLIWGKPGIPLDNW